MTDDTAKASRSDSEPDSEASEDGESRGKIYQRMHANRALALTSKIAVTTVGTAVLLAGIVMLVTPGPAFVLIPLGLAILATEFEWARRWLEKARDQARKAKDKAASMDPRARRRRLLIIAAVVLVVVGAAAAYVTAYGWPSFAISGWDQVQSLAGWVPDLPGM